MRVAKSSTNLDSLYGFLQEPAKIGLPYCRRSLQKCRETRFVPVCTVQEGIDLETILDYFLNSQILSRITTEKRTLSEDHRSFR
jgi:hypothetical protein